MLERATQSERTEGPVARAIEKQTSKLPSDMFLWAAMGSMAVSLLLQTAHRKEQSVFFGQWVPTLLIFGLYNKLVKVAGSDRLDQEQGAGFQSQSQGGFRSHEQPDRTGQTQPPYRQSGSTTSSGRP
jgi:hypothetical protein